VALFPQLGPSYYDEKDRGVLQRMEHFYSESISINQSFWQEADTDERFNAGDQTLWNEIYGNLPAHRRRQFQFNRIRRVINMVSGFQRRNRKSTIVTPVENADNETADQFTQIMLWANRQEGILETISNSFHGALVTGMNLLQVWVDYRSDPVSGNIRVDNCAYNSFLIDPFFRKPDLSDCNGLWKRTYLTKKEVLSLLPGSEEEIMGLSGYEHRDGKFEFLPENYNYSQKNLLTYDEFYYRDFRSQKMLVDSETGETMEWKSQDEDALKEFKKLYPQISTVTQEIPTVRMAIVVAGKVMYDGPNPIGIDKYPFVPVLGYFHPQIPYYPWRIQGMVRGLRDAQYLYNRRRIIELDILESQVTSGFKYKENALVNPKDIFLSGQGRGIALKEDAQMSDVEQIQPPQIPASMIQLSELLAQEVNQISGVNEELLGSAVDEKAGILSMLRQGAGLTTLQILFDQLDYSQKLLGGLMIDVIQANFMPGKVARIIEKKPSPQFYSKAFGTYDAAVEDGLNTTTQRQMQFAQMLQLREVGVPITDEDLLHASTMQNKNELVENMQKRQQEAAKVKQAQEQAALQEQQARIELAQARAIADRGLGIERISRVDENHALAEERRSEAVKDRMSGMLDIVKALKEMDDIDLRQVHQLLALANIVKSQETSGQQEGLSSALITQGPVVGSIDRGLSSRGNNLAGRGRVGGGMAALGFS
jgi:hypothetical protein